jgi:hypothetical protein
LNVGCGFSLCQKKSMSIKSKIKSWTTEIGEYYSGSLYKHNGFSLFRLFRKIISRVELAEEYVEELKDLAKKRIVLRT